MPSKFQKGQLVYDKYSKCVTKILRVSNNEIQGSKGKREYVYAVESQDEYVSEKDLRPLTKSERKIAEEGKK